MAFTDTNPNSSECLHLTDISTNAVTKTKSKTVPEGILQILTVIDTI